MIDCPSEAAEALIVEARSAEVADAERRFTPGTVVRRLDDPTVRGIVEAFLVAGDRAPWGSMAGDMVIRFSAGHHRVSNRYSEWEPVPDAELTAVERVHGVLLSHPGDPEPDEDGWVEKEATLAWKLLVAVAALDDAAFDRVFPWDGDWPLDLGELALLLAREGDRTAGRCSCRGSVTYRCAVHGLA